MSELIVGSAIRMDDGRVFSVEAPGRHHNVMAVITATKQYPAPIDGDEGFITNTGRFLNRIDGMELAKLNGQFRRTREDIMHLKELYSEDLW